MSEVLCVLQARMSSTRLPGKVLKPILGRAMIGRQIDRIRRSKRVDHVIVATSVDTSDDALEAFCQSIEVPCHRGSLNDVLDRYFQAVRSYHHKHIMRLTGDCPLTDPSLLDVVVEQHFREDNDYTSNVHERTYPDGLDAELFRRELLERAWREARSPFEREHVTPYMYRTGPAFKRGVVRNDTDRSGLRWTVDYPEDLAFVTRVFEELLPRAEDFGMKEVLALLERRPELSRLNARVERA